MVSRCFNVVKMQGNEILFSNSEMTVEELTGNTFWLALDRTGVTN